jgi:hypothetical protein
MTRQELYERVWSVSMHKLAPCFGLSDIGLKKLCYRYKVPTPPRGYWAKKNAGQAVTQFALPVVSDPALQVILVGYNSDPKPEEQRVPPCPVKAPDLVALIERGRDPRFKITVPLHGAQHAPCGRSDPRMAGRPEPAGTGRRA